MKLKALVTGAMAASLTASAALAGGGLQTHRRPDVVYTVVFLKDGKSLDRQTVVGQFGREVRVEIPNLMRVVVMAEAPDANARSFTSAKMSIFQNGVWQSPKEMSMPATLSMTPSFEYSVEGTPYRFVVMPRSITPAANESEP